MKTPIYLLSSLFLFATVSCITNTIHLEEVSAQPLAKEIDKVLIVFEGAIVYDKYLQKLGERMISTIEKDGLSAQAFYKGMQVYGQKTLQQEEELLQEKIKDFQPSHLLLVKQDMNLVYYSSLKNPIFNDTGKRARSQFNIQLVSGKQSSTLNWEGVIAIQSEKVFGNKISPVSIRRTNQKIMDALKENSYF